MKVNVKNIIFFIVMILLFVSVASFWSASANRAEEPRWSEIVDLFEKEQVVECVVSSNDVVTLKVKDEEGKERTLKYQLAAVVQFEYINEKALENRKNGSLKVYDIEAPKQTPAIVQYIPYILLLGLGILAVVVAMRASGGMGGKMNSFSRAKARTPGSDPTNTVKFSDVAGADEEKEELWDEEQLITVILEKGWVRSWRS